MRTLKLRMAWLFAQILIPILVTHEGSAALICRNVHTFDSQVYWIQIQNLKQINTDLAKSGGAHDLLAATNATILTVQRQYPGQFSLTRSTYKDIVVTTDKPENFEANILPVITSLTKQLRDNIYSLEGLRTEAPIVQVGKGATHLEAILNLKLGNSGFNSWPNYKAELLRLYKKIDSHRQSLGLNWHELIAQENKLAKANQKSLISTDFENLKKLTNIADYLTGVEINTGKSNLEYRDLAWIHNYDQFKQALPNYGTLVAVDMKGFGNLSTLKRFEWVKKDANLEEIPDLYWATTRYLENTFQNIRKSISDAVQIPETEIAMTSSGDDGLFALPRLTKTQSKELSATLERLRAKIYSATMALDPAENADTNIARTRSTLLAKEQ